MRQPRDSIVVAAASYPPDHLTSLDAWRDKLERWLGEARNAGAELAILPEYAAMELAATGADGAEAKVQTALAAVSDRLEAADAIHREIAAKLGLHIIAGSGPSRGVDGRYRNVARLIAPNGEIGRQEKLMLTPWEREWGLARGERPRVFETAIGRIGIAICYDSEFPLIVRGQAEAGADVIVIPACTDALTGYSRVRAAAMARALESQCATVLAPLSGAAPWCPAIDENVGAAGVFGPADRGVSDTGVLSEGRLGATGWTIARIDLAAIRASRGSGEVRTYVHWTEQPGAVPIVPFAEVVDLS